MLLPGCLAAAAPGLPMDLDEREPRRTMGPVRLPRSACPPRTPTWLTSVSRSGGVSRRRRRRRSRSNRGRSHRRRRTRRWCSRRHVGSASTLAILVTATLEWPRAHATAVAVGLVKCGASRLADGGMPMHSPRASVGLVLTCAGGAECSLLQGTGAAWAPWMLGVSHAAIVLG
eukprot:5441217-Prymnesium_polylepis.1